MPVNFLPFCALCPDSDHAGTRAMEAGWLPIRLLATPKALFQRWSHIEGLKPNSRALRESAEIGWRTPSGVRGTTGADKMPPTGSACASPTIESGGGSRMAVTVWKGHLTFGLVSIPVRLFRAARRERINLHQLRRRDESGESDDVWQPPGSTLATPPDVALPAAGRSSSTLS